MQAFKQILSPESSKFLINCPQQQNMEGKMQYGHFKHCSKQHFTLTESTKEGRLSRSDGTYVRHTQDRTYQEYVVYLFPLEEFTFRDLGCMYKAIG